MLLSVSSVLLATSLAGVLTSAHPHDDATVRVRAHDEHAKRYNTHLASRALTLAAHRARFNGSHELRDIPDDHEFPGDPADDGIEGLFQEGYEEGEVFERSLPSVNVTELLARADLDLEKRGTVPKAGVGWTNEVAPGIKQFGYGKVFGLYTWTHWWPEECKKYDIDFFPMLKTDAKKTVWKQNVKKGWGNKYMMAANEVNLKSEANMTPGHAQWLIETYMYPLMEKKPGDGGFKLIGPSTANGETAFTWYNTLRKNSPGVYKNIHAIAVHFYGIKVDVMIAYLARWHKEFPDKQIWITEFGCHSFSKQGPCPDAVKFLKTVAAYCDANDWCGTYMPFGTFVHSRVGVSQANALFSSNSGSLSTLGHAFLAN